MEKYKPKIVFDQTYNLLQQAKAALVTSGTATLETALFRVPQAVCYKTPLKHIAAFVWKHFFKVKNISLVNLIAGKEVVTELFNEKFTMINIRKKLEDILYNVQYASTLQSDYQYVIDKLGDSGASDRAAKLIAK